MTRKTGTWTMRYTETDKQDIKMDKKDIKMDKKDIKMDKKDTEIYL